MKASIILVTWANSKSRMDLLKETIESLKKSTDVEYELIVVDNGPIEQTEYLKTQEIDKHIINSQNKGIGFARNQGYNVATGDYVIYIDNDLIFAKDWLQEGIDLLEKYSDKKFVVATCYSYHQAMADKFYVGRYKNTLLWTRGCPAGAIMKRIDAEKFGKFTVDPMSGTKYGDTITSMGYVFATLLFPKVVHRGIRMSYRLIDLIYESNWKKVWDFDDK